MLGEGDTDYFILINTTNTGREGNTDQLTLLILGERGILSLHTDYSVVHIIRIRLIRIFAYFEKTLGPTVENNTKNSNGKIRLNLRSKIQYTS